MASEQLARRENTTTEREIRVEKDRVPKMTTHFEHLAEQGKEPPQGSIEELQGGKMVKDHAGKAIGDVGGRGKARETHELGAHFESLADKVRGEGHTERDSGHAANILRDKQSEGATREGHGGVRDVGKFEMKGERKGSGSRGREELERQTREVMGTPGVKEKSRGDKGQVVAEKGRVKEQEAMGRVGAENEGSIPAGITLRFDENKARGRTGGEKAREEIERSTMEEISKYRDQALSAAQERREAKQPTNETLNSTTTQEKTAREIAMEKASQAKDVTLEKASQAKDVTLEKGQQGYAATKDTLSSAAKTAADYTAPVAEKAKGYTAQAAEKAKDVTVQAKDVTVETGKTAAEYAGKVAADLKDKAAAAGWTAAHFSAEKTVQGTKAAANVVEGAAGYAGQKAAQLASKGVDAVKGLAASAGETAKEYTARKKEESQRELEAKKAAQNQEVEGRPSEGIGETVSQYAQKLKPSGESTQGGQAQGTGQEGMGSSVLTAIGETMGTVGEKVKKPFESLSLTGGGGKESGYDQSAGQVQGNETMTAGEMLGDAAQRMKKPLDDITEGGSEVLGAVGETVGEIGQNMIKPAKKVQERGQEGKGGGVLDAIGEAIVEIAQTTQVIVAGDDDRESRHNIGSESRLTDRGKH
ncbi:Late embryogenesis abundant protein [Sesbania bispinosa]|nr:Late embryogenesis abundant protein [Sesbania bispinosa]